MEGTRTGQWLVQEVYFLNTSYKDIANRATQIFDILFDLDEYTRKDRQGGVLVLAKDPEGAEYIAVAIGTVPDDDPKKYCQTALKKCKAIWLNCGHSSFAHRDEANEIYGGGIALSTTDYTFGSPAEEYISGYLAFSGLPELADEALVLVLALDMGWIMHASAQVIAEASNNPYFAPLLSATKQKLQPMKN